MSWSSARISAASRWRLPWRVALASGSADNMSVAHSAASASQVAERARSAGATLAGKTMAPTMPAHRMPMTISSMRATAMSKTCAGSLTAGSATIGSV